MTTALNRNTGKPIDGPDSEGNAVAGKRALGDFELLRELGRGGMGTVYEAVQVSLQRTVALKVLSPHVSSTPNAVARFRREAHAAARLHHTHIVPIFAQGDAGGVYFYAMEYIEGVSLNARIGELRDRHRPMEMSSDPAETVAIERTGDSASRTRTSVTVSTGTGGSAAASGSGQRAKSSSGGFGGLELFHDVARHLADVADALDYAHSHGVMHRDIKPHNLLFGRDGRIRISDFGLARLAEQPGVTVTGEMLGSPLYMSPEQITGDPNQVDHRTDIYSLGATMYEWLTLTPPYPGETRERVISRILSSEPNSLRAENPRIPVDLETICLKAIEREPSRRYQSAGELRDDLRRFMMSQPIAARRAGPLTHARRFVRRHQLASLAGLAVVIAGGLSIALLAKEKNVRQQKEVAVKAEAAVEVAEQTIEAAKEERDMLVEALGMFANVVPGGGAVLERVARSDIPRGEVMAESLGVRNLSWTIGTPSAIARRAVEEFFRSVLSPDWPPSTEGEQSSVVAKIHSAFEQWATGDGAAALALVNEYLSAQPTDLEALQMRGALHATLGRFDELRQDAEQMLRLPGSGSRGYVWRGLSYLLQNRAEPSLMDLTRAAALDQHSVWAKVFRGLALLQADRCEDALAIFDEVLKASPGLLAARLGRARAMSTTGDYAAAVPDLTEVLKLDPKNEHALTMRGECLASMEQYDAARKDLTDAMEVAGRLPELLARWSAIVMKQRGAPDTPNPDSSSEMKSRRGTLDPEDDSTRPPLFDWLSPRRKTPRGGPGGITGTTNSGLRMRIPAISGP